MSRTCVVTGAASGIGKAVRELLTATGDRVIAVDIRDDVDVVANLAAPLGRQALADRVSELSGGCVDAVIACAGVSPRVAGASATVSVNFFGAVATLTGLRPQLAASNSPRAVVVSSFAAGGPATPALVDACLAFDEERARAIAEEEGPAGTAYPASKRALNIWVRRSSITPDWAGSGITLNAITPGTVRTPMMEPLLADPHTRERLDALVPMPLGHCTAEHVAELLGFLAGPGAGRITGAVIPIDGGADAVTRGATDWLLDGGAEADGGTWSVTSGERT